MYTHTKAHRLLRDAGTRTDTTVHTCYRHMGVHMGCWHAQAHGAYRHALVCMHSAYACAHPTTQALTCAAYTQP